MDLPMVSLDQKVIQFPLKVHRRKEKEIELSFHPCKTSKQIVYLWYGLAPRESLDTEVDLSPFTDKKKSKGPISKAIKIAEEFKKWGFYRRLSRKSLGGEIFFWVSEKGKALDLIHVLAHEIAHSSGIKDEDEANKFAAISTFSTHVASKFSKGKIKLR